MHDLIVFGEDLGGLPSSTQHLITRLAKQRKVVWINSIGLRQPKLTKKDLKRAFSKLLPAASKLFATAPKTRMQPKLMVKHKNLTEVNLLTIPAPQSRLARQVAKDMMLHQLKPILAKAQLNNPILWSSLPTAADLCGELGESAVVYYCGDDFGALAGVDHSTVRQHEAKLAKKADLILAASDTLKQQFPASKTYHLPHGVDSDLFSKPAPRAVDLPQGKPVAGFYGSLSNWLDYNLIQYLCSTMPDWNFVFIGPCELNRLPLPVADNVFYLGKRAHHELPGYSQHWDVSLLPFIQNEQIQACNPLKLLEYMATGRPVVSVDFPALTPYKPYLHVANHPEHFAAQIRTAAVSGSISPSVVTSQSWNERSQRLNQLLELL